MGKLSSFPKPNLQRRLIFVILILFVLLAAILNFMAFFLNWEDIVHGGVRQTTTWWDMTDPDCEDHPWSRHVYLECERSSGIGAVGSSVKASDCIRVCDDDPCAGNRRIASQISVSFTIASFVILFFFLLLLIAGLFFHVWLPLVATLFFITLMTTVASWAPFWLAHHGHVASCGGVGFCPDGAARCDVFGFVFMCIVSALLFLGFVSSVFFDCIYLRFWGRKVDAVALETDFDDDEAPAKTLD